jgi:hypothetical protein
MFSGYVNSGWHPHPTLLLMAQWALFLSLPPLLLCKVKLNRPRRKSLILGGLGFGLIYMSAAFHDLYEGWKWRQEGHHVNEEARMWPVWYSPYLETVVSIAFVAFALSLVLTIVVWIIVRLSTTK